MIKNPRHIEVQILADKFGNIIHLGERDCSIQRRRQKLIEEAPSPKISSPLRKKITQCAINIIEEANYYSAATVEFLIDEKNNELLRFLIGDIRDKDRLNRAFNDIDIVIIGKEKNLEIYDFKKKLNREINIHFFSWSEWNKKAKEDNPFYYEVINKGIALYGELPIVRWK